MKIRTEWFTYLHNVRKRELTLIFARCPRKLFQDGLELGAGDGFQSVLLARYVSRLISTDYNPGILTRQNSESIEYQVCDAEEVDTVFGEGQFDLVFSSNLLEHLPDTQRTLRGVHAVLKDDGITIHVMPSPFWKLCHLVLHPINRLIGSFERMTEREPLARKVGKAKRNEPAHPAALSPGAAYDNNPKIERAERALLSSLILPRPHGASRTNLEEFFAFRRSRWLQEFERANLQVVGVLKGPVSSGYGFGLDSLRNVLERFGLASEYVYIAVKRGTTSPYKHYFESCHPSGQGAFGSLRRAHDRLCNSGNQLSFHPSEKDALRHYAARAQTVRLHASPVALSDLPRRVWTA